jgi:hypothetical protein
VSNVVKLKPAEFININGRPLGVSMKQLVLRGDPKAWVEYRSTTDQDGEPRNWYTVKSPEYEGEPAQYQGFIGSGETEEAAWRDAYFAIMGSASE